MCSSGWIRWTLKKGAESKDQCTKVFSCTRLFNDSRQRNNDSDFEMHHSLPDVYHFRIDRSRC
jgi:hypothetical protein